MPLALGLGAGFAKKGLGKLFGKGKKLLKRAFKKENIDKAKRALGTPGGRRILRRVGIGAGVAGGGAVAVGGRGRRRKGGMELPGEEGMGAGAGFRRYRRINPGNTRAMRRAIRRVTSGAKLYSKLFSITKRSVPGTRPGVRIRRKRRAA